MSYLHTSTRSYTQLIPLAEAMAAAPFTAAFASSCSWWLTGNTPDVFSFRRRAKPENPGREYSLRLGPSSTY